MGGVLRIEGGSNIVTDSSGGSALYNESGGTIIIMDGIIRSAQQAAITNNNNARLEIYGGTLISSAGLGINNSGTLIIGTDDGNVDTNSPIIRGKTNGINSTKAYSFFDGTIMGVNNAVNNLSRITTYEDGYTPTGGTTDVEGTTYKTLYLNPSN